VFKFASFLFKHAPSLSVISEKIGNLGLVFFKEHIQSGLWENHKSGFSICLVYENGLIADDPLTTGSLVSVD